MQKGMMIEEELRFITVINRATKLLCGNIKFVLFLFLCSLPLFGFLIFFELSLQNTVPLASQYISSQYMIREINIWNHYYVPPLDDASSEKLIPLLIQISLLYLFPHSLLDLLTTTTIVSASWTVHMSDEEPLRLSHLVRRTIEICQNKIEGCLITYLYVLLYSTSVFFGFFFVATNYFYIISIIGFSDYSYYFYINIEEDSGGYYRSNSFEDPIRMLIDTVLAIFHGATVLAIFHSAIFLVLLEKFSKWSVGWNMSLVVSVQEEEENGQGIYGTDALTLSACYGRGNEKRGLWVMLVFFIFSLAMRTPCFCFKCTESSYGNRVLYTSFYVGFICIGNIIKWVACLVFYENCRIRVLEKKGDGEIGSKAKAFVA